MWEGGGSGVYDCEVWGLERKERRNAGRRESEGEGGFILALKESLIRIWLLLLLPT